MKKAALATVVVIIFIMAGVLVNLFGKAPAPKFTGSVEKIVVEKGFLAVHTSAETIKARFVINCAGVYADQVLTFSSGDIYGHLYCHIR